MMGHTTAAQQGFTLSETLIAMMLVALLLAVSVPLYQGYLASTRTVDVLNALKAVELEIRAPALARGGLVTCDNTLVLPDNLVSEYLQLDIASSPISAGNPQLGRSAVMVVTAESGKHGLEGVRVARNFLEEVRSGRPNQLGTGVVSTDAVVSFNILLSPPGKPFCKQDSAVTSTASIDKTSTSNSVTTGPQPANQPPVAGTNIDAGTTKEDVSLAIPAATLLKGSLDPDGDSLSIVSVSSSPGQIQKESGETYRYDPPEDFFGKVSLTFNITDGTETATGTGILSVTPVTDVPDVNLNFSAEQKVLEFDQSGTGAVITNGPLATGDMTDLAVEFNVIGGNQVQTVGYHGATFLSYGTSRSENEFYVWNPSDVTVRIFGKEYQTGFDAGDGKTHRYTVLWSSSTGMLKVIEDGERTKEFSIGKGGSIPGGGVLVLAQDQDGSIQLEDGSHGGDHGFDPADAYHGQIFSAAVANVAVDPGKLKDATLSAVVGRGKGLVADIQMSSSGVAEDLTGNHQLTQTAGISTQTVQVDTSLAIPNPGALLRLQASASAKSGDKITKLELSGLIAGTLLTDGNRQVSIGSPSQKVNVLGMNANNLSAQLPNGVMENMNISLTATATGVDGKPETATVTRPLILDPTRPLP